MTNKNFKTKAILLTALLLIITLALTAFTANRMTSAHANEYSVDIHEPTIYSTATLEDNFLDCAVIVVLTLQASRNLNDLMLADFPTVQRYF